MTATKRKKRPETFRDLLSAVRYERRLPDGTLLRVADLAEACGCTRQMLYMIADGTRNPSDEQLAKIAKGLRVPRARVAAALLGTQAATP